MPELVIIRGLPGSGKSTMAKKMASHYHVEADMYFVNSKGEYTFNGLKIGDAHDWCQQQVAYALEAGVDVVVSNTFTRLCEMMPYVSICEALKIPFRVIEMKKNYGSIHNIPEASLKRMRDRWEEI